MTNDSYTLRKYWTYRTHVSPKSRLFRRNSRATFSREVLNVFARQEFQHVINAS